MEKKGFNNWFYKHYVVCSYCGYNNESERFQNYGTCLRCHRVINKKIFIRRLPWECKSRYNINENVNYGKGR